MKPLRSISACRCYQNMRMHTLLNWSTCRVESSERGRWIAWKVSVKSEGQGLYWVGEVWSVKCQGCRCRCMDEEISKLSGQDVGATV